jgi:DNA polymerase-3 subunit epsilon
VDDGAIAETVTHLIRPPRKHIVFDYIHGITWRDVCDTPVFGELWPDIRRSMEGVSFIAAHNASFDKSVLGACCSASGHRAPAEGFLCTVKVAREVWGIYPTKLPDVCQRLRIPLKHHDAASDARACAQIVLAAAKKGFDVLSLVQKTATAQRGN